MSRPPNILVLIPHDLGDFLGCYGHGAVPSPNLDRLADEGVRFTNCFTVCPECTCSRGGLMTGYQPHQNGLVGLANFGWSLKQPHLAARLAQQGYRTHLFGFQHETNGDPRTLGYDEIHSQDSKDVRNVCAALSGFLRSHASGGDAPWFGYAGFTQVHRDWEPRTEFSPADVAVPAFLPDTELIRRDLAHFYQDIRVLDQAIGSALDALRRTGRDRNTLVIFTTDHGAAFPGAKATFYDPGIRVPLITRLPGRFDGGRVQDELLSNMDVTPTLLALAGAQAPADMPGRSFLPLLRREGYTEREYVAGAMFFDVAYDPAHYIRTRTHKYIRSFAVDPQDKAGARGEALSTFTAGRWARLDDLDVLTSPSWQHWPLPVTGPEAEELYDLQADPVERRNLAATPAAAAELREMRGHLCEMMTQTGSPLLHGHPQPNERQLQASRSHGVGGKRFRELVAKREELLKCSKPE